LQNSRKKQSAITLSTHCLGDHRHRDGSVLFERIAADIVAIGILMALTVTGLLPARSFAGLVAMP
jgi:hypothetical protein